MRAMGLSIPRNIRTNDQNVFKASGKALGIVAEL